MTPGPKTGDNLCIFQQCQCGAKSEATKNTSSAASSFLIVSMGKSNKSKVLVNNRNEVQVGWEMTNSTVDCTFYIMLVRQTGKALVCSMSQNEH